MTEDLLRAIDAMSADLVAWRRQFHRHPELAFKERHTSAVIRGFLEECGIDVQTYAGTGLRGLLRGGADGPTVALRADMDALAVGEEGDKEYRSEHAGVMHACGHDGHMAIVMGVAKLFSARREELHGNVVFLFQPSEEDPPGGAKRMIAEGALDGVDRIFGLHLWQPLPSGVIGIRPGPMMAQADKFKIVVTGKGGHASQPRRVIDPVLVASHVVVAAQAIVSRFVDPIAPVVVSFTTIHGGRVHNIVPDSVTLTGTVRAFDLDVKRTVKVRLGEVAEQTSAAFGASAELEYEDGYPPLVNETAMTDLLAHAAEREFGRSCVITIPPLMGGEDFAYYLQQVPGAFAMLGIGDAGPHPHHSPRFDIDERMLPVGVRLLTAVTLDALAAH